MSANVEGANHVEWVGCLVNRPERLIVSTIEPDRWSDVHFEVAHLLPDSRRWWPSSRVSPCRRTSWPVGGGFADPSWPLQMRRLARRYEVVRLHSPPSPPSPVRRRHRAPRQRQVGGVGGGRHLGVVGALAVEHRGAPPRHPGRRLHREAGEALRHPEERGWAPDDIGVACVANLRANKDHPTLCAATARAIARELRLRFVAIGYGPLEVSLRVLLEIHSLGDRLEMLGYLDDPASVLAGAAAFTLSSVHPAEDREELREWGAPQRRVGRASPSWAR